MKSKIFLVLFLITFLVTLASCSDTDSDNYSDTYDPVNPVIYLEAGADEGTGLKGAPYGDVLDAVEKAKELSLAGAEHITFNLRAGDYSLTETLALNGADFGNASLEFICEDDDMAVIGAWLPVTGFTETEVNGVKAWVADMPKLNGEPVYSYQFFSSDYERLERPRYPEEGYLVNEFAANENLDKLHCEEIEYKEGDAYDYAFYFYEGDIPENLTRIEDMQMCMFHYWNDERLNVKSIDYDNNLLSFSQRTLINFREWDGSGARYYLDNVFEYLNSPGEVYNDRATGKLYYIPEENENIDECKIYVSTIDTLLTIDGMNGSVEKNSIEMKNIGFVGSDWKPMARWASQAASDLPAAVTMFNSSYMKFEECSFDHIGNYAIEIQTKVNNVTFDHCSVSDIGAGGFRITGANVVPVTEDVPHDIVITDCTVSEYGRVYRCAVGILLKYAYDCTISHNNIFDGYYTAISVGWSWGYADHATSGITVEKNHIYDIGQGILTDLGGIYTLGIQPGTVIRGNLVHDISDYEGGYGGFACYNDEGSTGIVVENNIGYNTTGPVYTCNYGKDLVIRNNIFAFGRLGGVHSNSQEDGISFVFERNIVVNDFGPIYRVLRSDKTWADDSCLLWDYTLKDQIISHNKTFEEEIEKQTEAWVEYYKTTNRKTIEENGLYKNAVVADPLFADPFNYDFTLAENSPAFDIGFEPIDISDVGPRS